MIGNGLGIFDLDYLDLWPCDPKLNMVAMLLRMDVWTRYEKGRSMHFLVIHRKRFWHICPRWPLTQWPPKSIGFLCYTWLMWWLSWRKVRQVVLEFRSLTKRLHTDGLADRHVHSSMPAHLRRPKYAHKEAKVCTYGGESMHIWRAHNNNIICNYHWKYVYFLSRITDASSITVYNVIINTNICNIPR